MGDGGGTPRGTEVVKVIGHGHGHLGWRGCDGRGHGRVRGATLERGSRVMVVLIGKGRVGRRILGRLATTVVVIVTHGWFVHGRVHGVELVGLHGGMIGTRRVIVGATT